MNIKGLDYNTQRDRLVLPEYGREIQQMVEYAVKIKDKAQRQRCAETIVVIMDRMFPENRGIVGYKQKLWDQLAIMSNFQLDIDYPYSVPEPAQVAQRPKSMDYPMQTIKVRHYGLMLCELFEKLKTMKPGPERDRLVVLTANQMHRDLMQWSHGSCDVEKVASDLARYTDGNIQIDPKTFVFCKADTQMMTGKQTSGRQANGRQASSKQASGKRKK